jgi:curved DNA-binding protein CbpA
MSKATPDYYEVLGLESTATKEDVKSAHILLAKKYHPDTAEKSSSPSSSSSSSSSSSLSALPPQAKFIAIQNAYAVLSNPLLKKEYDDSRSAATSSRIAYSDTIPDVSYGIQQANYTNVRKQASSNWMEIKDKYKTEKWQNLPLEKRKFSRQRPISSLGGGIISLIGPVVLTFATFYGLYYFSGGKNKKK